MTHDKHPIIIIVLMIAIVSGIYLWKENSFSNVSLGEEQVAQISYTQLSPLPGTSPVVSGGEGAINYLQKIVNFGIGIAIVLAVLMIVIGGVQYMASDAFTSKEDAKGKITMALGGLIIALGGYLLLYIINPDLVTFRFSFTGRNIQTKTPIQTVSNQIQEIVEKQKSGQEEGGQLTIENQWGRKQVGGKITAYPAGSSKYFDVTQYGGLVTDAKKKITDGAKQDCQRLGGVPKEELTLRGVTYTCYVK